jgi:hypothetical protein
MSRYTTTENFAFDSNREYRTFTANGTIQVSTWDGAAYVLTETKETGSYRMYTQGARLQFVITAGTSYTIDENGATKGT